ncbi:hypothetical protein [Actinomadura rudentiformis]|uniref:hypothetical protein n=1 Tax=Actinomadura rudentiformis TaxID=359158 RepID=UPI001CEF6142|nr:hypothetical protein [Actinomadura rudentiformis]
MLQESNCARMVSALPILSGPGFRHSREPDNSSKGTMTDPDSAPLHGAALTGLTLGRAYGTFPSGITTVCALLDHHP